MITERIREIAERSAAAHDAELVHVEMAGTRRNAVLRIFIDKEGGVSVDDCADVSRDVESALDVEDLIPSKYVLEVSSPGIERELYSLNDFVKFAGRLVKVRTHQPIDGRKTFVGVIAGTDGSTITIDDTQKGQMTLEHADIAKANLKMDLSEEFRGGR